MLVKKNYPYYIINNKEMYLFNSKNRLNNDYLNNIVQKLLQEWFSNPYIDKSVIISRPKFFHTFNEVQILVFYSAPYSIFDEILSKENNNKNNSFNII